MPHFVQEGLLLTETANSRLAREIQTSPKSAGERMAGWGNAWRRLGPAGTPRNLQPGLQEPADPSTFDGLQPTVTDGSSEESR